MLPPPPPPQPIVEESAPSQSESSTMGASISALVFKPSVAVPTLDEPFLVSMRVDSLWPPIIQRMALALTRTPSLFDDPTLAIPLTKNALRLRNCRHLNEL